MISTLAELVAPLSEEDFVHLLRERRPWLAPGAGVGRYGALVGWDTLMSAIRSPAYPARNIRLTKGGARLPRAFYRDANGVKPQMIERLMASGASLVAYDIEPHAPPLGRLCANIAARVHERVTAGVIASRGSGGALPPHYDDADLVVLQIEGAKRWIVEGGPVVDPVPGMPTVEDASGAGILLDVVLEAGDFLFLPAGYRHRCETSGEGSLHAGVFFWPLTAPRALDLLLQRMMQDPALRAPIRFDEAAAAAAEASLKTALADLVRDLSLRGLLADHATTKLTPRRH